MCAVALSPVVDVSRTDVVLVVKHMLVTSLCGYTRCDDRSFMSSYRLLPCLHSVMAHQQPLVRGRCAQIAALLPDLCNCYNSVRGEVAKLVCIQHFNSDFV